MFFLGLPPVVPVSVAASTVGAVGASGVQQAPHALGVCEKVVVESYPRVSVDPILFANLYMYDFAEYRAGDGNYFSYDDAKMTLVESPEHGRFVTVGDQQGVTGEDYVADAGWQGEDFAVFRVYQGGTSVTVKYYFLVDFVEDADDLKCTAQPAHGELGRDVWKISWTKQETPTI